MSMNKPSVYSASELPTWGEIQEWWDYSDKYFYDPERDSCPIDTYWKVPRKKYLIATMCNQFNKMIIEDGYRDKLLPMLNTRLFDGNNMNQDSIILDIIFQPYSTKDERSIFYFNNPSGKEDIFRSDYQHRLIDTDDPMQLTIVIASSSGKKMIHPADENTFSMIISYMMSIYQDYFSKDRNGSSKSYCIGFDPAI